MKTLTLIALMLVSGCAVYAPDRSNAKCAAEAAKFADAKARGLGPEWWRLFEGNAYDECVKRK